MQNIFLVSIITIFVAHKINRWESRPLRQTVGVVNSQFNRFTSSQLFLIMSTSVTLSQCPPIQADLYEQFKMQPFIEALPVLEFLNSPLNTAAIKTNISPGRGKLRQVEVTWNTRRQTSGAVKGADIKNCTASNVYGDNTQTYELSTQDTIQVDELIDSVTLAEHCKDNRDFLVEHIALMLDQLDRAVAEEIATQIAAQIGKWSTEVSGYTEDWSLAGDKLQIATKLTGGDIAPFTLQLIQMAARMSAYPSGAFVGFGGAAMNSYAMQIMAGCCAQYGIDLSAILSQYGFSFSYDPFLATALGGQNENAIMVPGAVQLLNYNLASWNETAGEIVQQGADYSRRIVVSRAGVPYDVNIKDDCGNLSLVATFTGKIITMPDDIFDAADKFAGVKWLNQVSIVNPS